MPRWILTALPVFILLSACKMGPEYVRPETQSEDTWRMAPASAESLANLPWWELLKDQELQKLIRTSLAENQDLRVAVASVEQFRARDDAVHEVRRAPWVDGFDMGAEPLLHHPACLIGVSPPVGPVGCQQAGAGQDDSCQTRTVQTIFIVHRSLMNQFRQGAF